MGKVTGFKETKRILPQRRNMQERILDWKEVYEHWSDKSAAAQAGRCMDCGIPFCSNGCPLGNLIPEWNDLVYRGDWHQAIKMLHATNNFPEFTGRICPAPCEPACTLAINDNPVTIEMIEKEISNKAWEKGWIKPTLPKYRTGFSVAIVGSGPAGLSAAQQLNRAGHNITVFERDEYIGGLLQLGIPEFKLEKWVVDRRVDQMKQEGIVFQTSTNVGVDISAQELIDQYDAVCLAGGSTVPRDLPVPGRNINGVWFAMEYLTQQNRILKGKTFPKDTVITAQNKHVVIIGGGDTGADCLGTAHRQKPKQITQIEIMPKPPQVRNKNNPWPEWPLVLHTSSAHEEGGERDFCIVTKQFNSSPTGKLQNLTCKRVKWSTNGNGSFQMNEIPGSEFIVEADLVLLAMGFVHPQHEGLLDDLGTKYDVRGNVKTNSKFKTSIDKVFACGDMQRGQSLVVHAIASGRACARQIDIYLTGTSSLPDVHAYVRPNLNYTT